MCQRLKCKVGLVADFTLTKVKRFRFFKCNLLNIFTAF